MESLSPEIENEIRRRVQEGPYSSADELLRLALKALDDSVEASSQWLEQELLRGLEGKEVEVTSAEFSRLRERYLRNATDQEG